MEQSQRVGGRDWRLLFEMYSFVSSERLNTKSSTSFNMFFETSISFRLGPSTMESSLANNWLNLSDTGTSDNNLFILALRISREGRNQRQVGRVCRLLLESMRAVKWTQVHAPVPMYTEQESERSSGSDMSLFSERLISVTLGN